MADNIPVTPGSGKTVATDEVVDGVLGTVQVQYVKIMDGTIDGTTKAAVGANGLKVDGSGATQPISGTVTANIGTTNGLALDATVSALQVSQGSSTSGEKGTLVLGAVTTAAPTYTTAQSSPFSLDTAGNLRVSNTPSGVQTTNVSQLNGTTISVNSGNKDNGTLRVVLATDQPSITNPIPVTLPANISPATQNVTAQDVASVSSTGANSQKIVTGAPTAGSTASFTVTAVSTVNVQVTGSWTGTLSLESSLDGGTTWYSNGGHQKGVPFNSSSFTANFECATNVAASTNFRIRATAAWTGTATILVVESVNDDSVYILNAQQILDGSGTNAKATVTASNALKVDGSAVTQPVGGVAAQGSSVSGNPVLIGLEARDTLGTVVATGQVVRGVADRYGRQYSIEPAVTYVSSAATPITTNTNTSTVAAPGAGNHLRIYRISAENSSSTATWMYWTEGSGGTKKFAWYLTQGSARSLNLVGSWNLPSATALFINTATTGANIEWNVGYETVAD